MRYARYWTVVLLLLIAVGALLRRGDHDQTPPSTPLAQFPMTLERWSGTDLPLDPEVLDVLGKGVFLNRNYIPQRPAADGAHTGDSAADLSGPISLFIGYFPTQRSGQSIHSPQNCLPGSGWTFEQSGTVMLTGPDGQDRPVNDFIISDGSNRAEVIYWYQSHGRAIASDYKAKLYMLADSIRYNRSDAALVRVVTPLRKGEDRAQAHLRAVHFAQTLVPLLPAYIPD